MSHRNTPLLPRLGRAFRAGWRELTGARGAFDGASTHRLLMDWIAQARSADSEIKGDIRMLRARARQLARNDAYSGRFFRLLQNNVIGPMGIRLQAQVTTASGDLDEDVNDRIETAWEAWSAAPVTIDGKLNLRRLENLLVKTWGCDGEALVRIWKGFAGNPFGIGLQVLDADLLDETYNRQRQGTQNEIRMGVEIDAVGRPVGYWFWSASTIAGQDSLRERYFVPADELIHLYRQDRANQTRGVTWLHSIMVPAHMLKAYEETEAVAARIGASSGFALVKRPDSEGADLATGKAPAQLEMNPGMGLIVPNGYDIETLRAEHPTTQLAAFVKQMLRRFASGVSVFYNALASDGEAVTYSTMRSFALIERDDWRSIQSDFIDIWRRPLFPIWLDMALLSGMLVLPTRNPARYMAVRHRPRGWQWVDPEKEANGAVVAIENGLGTRTGFLAEKGEDLEDVFVTLAREKKLAEKYGIEISGGSRTSVEKPGDGRQPDEQKPGSNGDGNKSAAVLSRLGI
jgi:lambda family phage portal protein